MTANLTRPPHKFDQPAVNQSVPPDAVVWVPVGPGSLGRQLPAEREDAVGTGPAPTVASHWRWMLVWSVLIAQTLMVAWLAMAPEPRPVYGGGVIPTADPSEQARDAARVPALEPGFVGARITASANQVATDGPLTFDTVRWDSGFWDESQPTRLTFPADAVCEVRAQITVLGTIYEGAPANDVGLFVRRDGDPTAFVAYARLSDEDPQTAHGLDAATTDWFEAGEYVEVFVTPDLLVEANWPGRSNVSPVLTVVC